MENIGREEIGFALMHLVDIPACADGMKLSQLKGDLENWIYGDKMKKLILNFLGKLPEEMSVDELNRRIQEDDASDWMAGILSWNNEIMAQNFSAIMEACDKGGQEIKFARFLLISAIMTVTDRKCCGHKPFLVVSELAADIKRFKSCIWGMELQNLVVEFPEKLPADMPLEILRQKLEAENAQEQELNKN